MVEGGSEFNFYDPEHDDWVDNDDYVGNYEEEVDTTRPFNLIEFGNDDDTTPSLAPTAASTPYHGGEEHEMQPLMRERGLEFPDLPQVPDLPSFGEMTPEEEKESILERARNFIKARFPRVDFAKLGPIGFSKRGTSDIVSFGRKGGEAKIFKANKSGLLKSFTDRFSTSLGPSAEEIIAEDRDTIQEQRQRAADADEQLRQANALAAEREKEEQEIQNLRQKIERTQVQIEVIQEEQGSNLESETELNRIKLLRKNFHAELEEKKKEVAALEKQTKNKEKAQAKADRERLKLAQMEQKRNELEERLNNTKPLDELNGRESELKHQNEEDQAFIQDKNTALSDREAAYERIVERKEELRRLQT